MKRIQIEQSFKDGGQAYYAGELRVVSNEDASRFCYNGWASDSDGELATGKPDLRPKKLKVDKGAHKGVSRI